MTLQLGTLKPPSRDLLLKHFFCWHKHNKRNDYIMGEKIK
uniref:Uncharacterized protein n=1 Tax=Anguilla anguilla TaxID=7936 RepID=A0A0E9V255_ANGAN